MTTTMGQTQTREYWTAQADAVSRCRCRCICASEEPSEVPEWDDYKYGLCEWCSKGLEDKSDLVVTEDGYGHTVMLCYDCGSE
jgi:hypothetical protein